jgi:DNA-binding transcriptional MerR regulator
MPFNRLSTAKIAKAVGCHPNTVRLYEQWGLISPVARSPKGYRLYTEEHLDQMRLVRLAFSGAYPGANIRHSYVTLIKAITAHDYAAAVELARRNQEIIWNEQAQAESAVVFLQRWARGEMAEHEADPLQILQAAQLLSVTVDMLRNWERNGLVSVPRNPANRYRQYGAAEIDRLRVIRLLRQTGYSPNAILRMLIEFDRSRGKMSPDELRRALDTPRPDEDVYMAADRWISTLQEHERRSHEILHLVETMAARYGLQDGPPTSA